MQNYRQNSVALAMSLFMGRNIRSGWQREKCELFDSAYVIYIQPRFNKINLAQHAVPLCNIDGKNLVVWREEPDTFGFNYLILIRQCSNISDEY